MDVDLIKVNRGDNTSITVLKTPPSANLY